MDTATIPYDVTFDNGMDGEPKIIAVEMSTNLLVEIKRMREVINSYPSVINSVNIRVDYTAYYDRTMDEIHEVDGEDLIVTDYGIFFVGYVSLLDGTQRFTSEVIYHDELQLYHDAFTCSDDDLPLFLKHQNNVVRGIAMNKFNKE